LWLEDETENPAGALKNLMYRLRTLLKKHFGETEFILTKQGSYHFNPELEVRVDAEQFEQMLEGIKQKQMKEEEAILELNTALALYQGDFMQKNTEMHWVITLTTYYHSLYLSGVKYLCDLYVSTRRFEELETLCSRALLKESLDEDLYCYLIKIKSVLRWRFTRRHVNFCSGSLEFLNLQN
jgi:DNA-binding SARP family transcriptional activator